MFYYFLLILLGIINGVAIPVFYVKLIMFLIPRSNGALLPLEINHIQFFSISLALLYVLFVAVEILVVSPVISIVLRRFEPVGRKKTISFFVTLSILIFFEILVLVTRSMLFGTV